MFPKELMRPLRMSSEGMPTAQSKKSRNLRSPSGMTPLTSLSQNQFSLKQGFLPSPRSLPSSAGASRPSCSVSGTFQPFSGSPGAQDEKVRVAVRCRPPNPTQGEQSDDVIVSMDPRTGQVFLLDQESSPSRVDIPLWSGAGLARDGSPPVSQVNVYETLGRPLLLHALEGYNSTLMAYGQTGSGKTYTMMGDYRDSDEGEGAGIIPRLCRELFMELASRSFTAPTGEHLSWEVHVRYVEIYCEKISDLLNSGASVGVREEITPNSATFALVGARRIPAASTEDLLQALAVGNRWRRTAATKSNDRSSRSHAIFSIDLTEIISFEEPDGTVASAPSKNLTIRLVDLAGSERVSETGVQGTQLKEVKDINLSLFTLGCVIECLSDGKRRGIKPPYRDSVLTKLLRDAFGGNSKTTMICTIGPCEAYRSQTIQTLHYAAKARRVMNKPRVKEDPSALELRRANEELLALRRQLEEAQRDGHHYASIEAELQEANARLRQEQRDARLRRQVMEKREAELATRLRELEDQRESYEAQMLALEAEADRARTQQKRRESELRRAHELADEYAQQRLKEMEEQRITSEAALRSKEDELLRSQRAIEDKMQAAEAAAKCRIDELQRQQTALEGQLKEKERLVSLQEREFRKKHKLAEEEARALEKRAFDMEEEWVEKVRALEAAAKQREEEVAQRMREVQGALCKAEAAARRTEEEMQQKWREADNEARRLQSEAAAKETELNRRMLDATRSAQQREMELNERLRIAECELNRRARESEQQLVEVESLKKAAARQTDSVKEKERTIDEQHSLRVEALQALENQLKQREAELKKHFEEIVQVQREWNQQRVEQQLKMQMENEAALHEVKQRSAATEQKEMDVRARNDALASKLRAQEMQLEKQQMDFLAQKSDFETAMQRDRHAMLRTREELQLAQDRNETQNQLTDDRLRELEANLRERRAELEATYQTREAALREKEASLAAVQDRAAAKDVELYQLQERLKTQQTDLQRRAHETRVERSRMQTDLITSLQVFEMNLSGSGARHGLEDMSTIRMSAEFKAGEGQDGITSEALNLREQRYFAAFESMYRGVLIREAEMEFRGLVRHNQLEVRDIQRRAQLTQESERVSALQMQFDAAVGERKTAESKAANLSEQITTLMQELEAQRGASMEVKVQMNAAVSAAQFAEAQLRQLRLDAYEAEGRQRDREQACQMSVAEAERKAEESQHARGAATAAALRLIIAFEEEQRRLLEHHHINELQSIHLLQISDRRVLDREGTVRKWQSLYRRRGEETNTAAAIAKDGDVARPQRTAEEAQRLRSLMRREETLEKKTDCLAAEWQRFEQRVADFDSYERTHKSEVARQESAVQKYLLELEAMDRRKAHEFAERERHLVEMAERLRARQAQVRTNAQGMFESLLQRSVEQQSALADAHEELKRVSLQREKYMEKERELLQMAQRGDTAAMQQLMQLHEEYVAAETKQLKQRARKLEREELRTKQRLDEQEKEIHRYLLEIEAEDIRRNELSQQGQEMMREAEARLSKAKFKEAAVRDLARQYHLEAMEAEEKSRVEETSLRRAEQETKKKLKIRKAELERKQQAASTAAETNERTLMEMETDLKTIVNKNKDTEHHIQSKDAEIKRQKKYYLDLSKMLEERDGMLRQEHKLRVCGTKNAGSLATDLLDVNDALRKQVITWKNKFDVLLHDGKVECEKCSWRNKKEASTCLCCGHTGILELTPIK
ncbi:putative kinesin [Leptomonas pyrrhocoris]|uniref:Putative kinesin n=1 Tax=Leptomonas pyrrhocoris TaxID=157538 RepID=A0A0M9G1I3_LEPPY|nr:putative kinesin [Leptomonas pyrrhocoris]KPA80445.1 putative kinesin [Leptomonas pyrrhocoris]|eukprot:XP_015658884.1 putative kinesin [Leptomonas pyrrhocoris]